MKKWAFLLGAMAAMGAAAVVVSLAIQQSRQAEKANEIPDVIADCFDRITRIERELHRLEPAPELAG
jgi:hypothetical protein